MTTPFRRKYGIERFDGGLNNKFEPSILDENESPDCQNVTFDDLGAVQTRKGYTLVNTNLVNTNGCDGLFTTRFSAGTQTMVGWWGGTMYAMGTTTFTTIGSAQSVYTAGQQVNAAQYQSYLFVGNGSTPYKYDGSVFTRHAIGAPESFVVHQDGGPGSLTGTYCYRITYVNTALAESDVGPCSGSLTVNNKVVSITCIPTAPQSWGVDARRLYRTESSGTTYLLVDTISDNSTTTYTDTLPDEDLGVNAPTDNGEPPDWNYCVAFQERLFAVETTAQPQFLYYSDIGEPFTWPSANFVKVGQGDGEQITGLGIHQNSIVIYKEKSVWLLYMQDTTAANWVLIKADSKFGLAGQKTVVDYMSMQMFLGKQFDTPTGFYSLTGNALQPDRTDLTVTNIYGEAKSERIEPEVFKIQSAYMDKAVGIIYQNKLWFSIPYDTGATTNNRVLQFDFVRAGKSRALGSWVPFTGIAASQFVIYDGNLYFADYGGYVYQLEASVYTDNGAAIDSYFWTKEFEGLKPEEDYEKDYRFANFTIENLGDWVIGVGHRSDSDVGSSDIIDVNTDPGGSLWGTMVWGVDVWGGGNVRSNVKVDMGTKIGKRIQFRFDNRNTASRAFKIIRGNFYYNRRGLR